MTAIDLNRKKRTADENDVLGRAVAQAIKAGAVVGPCPSLEDLGALAEGVLPDAESEILYGHLAVCDECDQTFRITREMLQGENERAPLPVRSAWRGYLAPGLAAAAVLALAITFTLDPDNQRGTLEAPSPAPTKEMPVAGVPIKEAPVAGTQTKERHMAAAPTKERHMAAAPTKEMPVAAAPAAEVPAARAPVAVASAPPRVEAMSKETMLGRAKSFGKAGVPPSFAQQAARQIALAAAPYLFPESEVVQGFATRRQASESRECYEIGQGLMRLALALNLSRLDLAAEQVGRMRALRSAKLLETDLASFEAALRMGEEPAAAGERLFHAAQKSVGDRLRYLSAGVWAEAARMSASSRNSEYFLSQSFVDETVKVRASGLPAQSVELVDQVAALAAGKPLTENGFEKIIHLTVKLRDSL